MVITDLELQEKLEYVIVGSAEADPTQYKISNESPVGKALIGQKVGTVVEVDVPIGIRRYRIESIQK